MKRLNAPSHWMLSKLGGIFAPKPSAGPHKLENCLPLCLVLRNRLKYALTRKEVQMICMRRLVQVDGKIRTDVNFPAGFMDVITIPKTGENFRLLYDSKGRFALVPIPKPEASFKLCRVKKVAKAKKASIGRNPFHTGQAASIPYVVTHDGRTIRYADPLIKVNDTVKVDLASGKVVDHVKFDLGNVCMITAGNNVGRVGLVVSIEKHPGSFNIVHLKDKRGHEFATRMGNVFVVGDSTPFISLPNAKGIRLTIIEEKAKKEAEAEKARKKAARAL
jgi:small subunit ribosomal protein S4e